MSRAFQEGVTPLELVQKVLREFEVEILETTPVEYRCYCSRERVCGALISLGAEELEQMIQEQKGAELSCQFCGKTYRFTEAELRELAESLKK